jgi:hypothetical protein
MPFILSIPNKACAVSLALALLAVSGCSRWCKPEIIRVPVEVERVRIVVEPIPAELLRDHPADAAPADQLHACPDIARQRLHELRRCNADKAAIRAMREGQGTR